MSKISIKQNLIIFFLVLLSLSFLLLLSSCKKDNKAELKESFVTINEQSFVYTGQEIKPQIEIKNGKKTFEKNVDYVVFYQNNTNAGTAKLVVSALESSKNLKGRVEKTFTIEKRSIEDTQIFVDELEFLGDPTVLPTVRMKIGEKEIDSKNYSLSVVGGYPDTQNTITISSTEQGNLFGSKTTNYTVNYMNLQSADIKVQQTSYNTEEQKPTFSITYKKHSLPENILDNFEITYQNNILPTTQAKLNLKVKTQNHYFKLNEQREVNFVINPANISVSNINDIPEYQYSRTNPTQAHKAIPVVSAFSNVLEAGVDYDVKYYRDHTEISQDSEFVDGGTIRVVIIGKNKFAGHKETSYFIRGEDISSDPNLEITFDDQYLEYTGYSQIPQDFTVKLDGEIINSYDVEYSNNINAGTNSALATVTFLGNFAGTKTVNFSINPKNIQNYLLELLETETTFSPNGAQIECLVRENEQGSSLIPSQDYTLEFFNNQNVSTDITQATVRAIGCGNYTGNTEFQSFRVIPAELTADMIELSNAELTFTGSEQKPTVLVKINNQLVDDSNYDITYYSDYNSKVIADDFINANQTIFMEISAKNNLKDCISGKQVLSYSIIPETLSSQNTTITLNSDSFVYDGTEKTPTITQILFCGQDLASNNYDLAYQNNTNAGKAQLVITGKNNVCGSFSKTFIITPLNAPDRISTGDLTVQFAEGLTYNGNIQNIIPTIDGILLTTNDYEINYYKAENGQRTPLSQNEVLNLNNAGIYEIDINFTNNFTGKISGTTIVSKKENSLIQTPNPSTWQYGQIPTLPTINAEFGTPEFLFATSETQNFDKEIPTEVGDYDYIIYIPESINYFGFKTSCSFSITKANLENAIISLKEIIVNNSSLESFDFDAFIYETKLTADDYVTDYTFINGELEITLTAKNESLYVFGTKVESFSGKSVQTPVMSCENSYVYGNNINITCNSNNAEIAIFKKLSNALTKVQNNQILDAGNYVVFANVNEDENSFNAIITKEFTIVPQTFSEENFLFVGFYDVTYSGLDVSLNQAISHTTFGLLEPNKDYTITYDNSTINYNPAGITATINFVGNYSGMTTKHFYINKKVILDSETIKTPYTGHEISSSFAFMNDLMVEGTDYEVLYYSNKERTILATAEQKTNAGVLFCTLKSHDVNYADCNFELEITKAKNNFTNDLYIQNFEYGDEILKPIVSSKFGDPVVKFYSLSDSSRTILEWTSLQKPEAHGTYCVFAEVSASQNYDAIHSSFFTFKITQQNLRKENITLHQASTSEIPTVTVQNKNGATLTQNSDYSIWYFESQIVNGHLEIGKRILYPTSITNSGTYFLSVRGKGNYTKSYDFTFEII